MKKLLSLFCTIFMTTLILAGCSSAKDTTKEEDVRTVSTVRGEVEVPANPKRVLMSYGIGDILALGVKPVATYDAKGRAYEKEVEDLPVWEKYEPEELMQYNPDLIITVSEENINELSKIAPTVYIPFTTISMEERLTFLGEVLNKQEEAKKLLSDFKEKVDNSKKELDSKGIRVKTISIFEGKLKTGIWTYGDKWGRGGDLIYSQLGFKAPDVIQNEIIGKDQHRQISFEKINDYAGDYIMFSGVGNENLEELADNSIWQSLPAVKEGHVIPIDFNLFYDIDIYSSNVQLDYLMDKLLES
ncbi:iron(3+)-hydroxamate-binding protein YxeB precursor [Clostridium puniceum]|uniref:Iron(3+)-hydroxamate-binding protein YxeB n=1 Tax=Clostridium puniceum TaxID=29367 RepID=A0A1S8TAY1_9CLOT|nr:ABC transporter substrate-binding protein [Clostridium puniceum]OOM74896.1 iron(3+)-hydroxamate-binding protein YxeB precursor [Clostridium puniceum]